MKVLSLILAVLCVSLSASAQQTTGPIVNTASVSVEADSDADNDGKFVVKTKHVERLVVDNDGKVGIATDTPTAFIDINPPATGPHPVLNVRTNEPGGGDFGLGIYTTPNIFTDPGGLLTGRALKSFPWGYNAPGTTNYNPNETSLFYNTEVGYVTQRGRAQDEFWMAFCKPNVACTRFFSADGYRDDGQTQVAFSTPRMIFANPDQSNLWLEFRSLPTSGTMTLYGNSEISFSGTKKYFMSHVGTGIIGRDLANSRVWNLVQGGAQNETLHIFESDQIANGPLAIKLGQDGIGISVGSSSKGLYRMQGSGEFPGLSDFMFDFDTSVGQDPDKLVKRGPSGEINVGAVYVRGKMVVGAQCPQDIVAPDLTGNESDNARAIIQILECLRSHGTLPAN